MRKRYTPQFKAKVVREILREEKSISQPATRYGVHATRLRKWKKRVPEKLPDLFITAEQTDEALVRLQKEQEQLYAEIGKLTTRLNRLKKKGIEIE